MEVRSRPERQVGRAPLEEFVSGIFEEEIHAKWVASLIDGVDGVLQATTQGLVPKHAIKPVDRLLSNDQLSRQEIFACWVPFVVAGRAEMGYVRDTCKNRSQEYS